MCRSLLWSAALAALLSPALASAGAPVSVNTYRLEVLNRTAAGTTTVLSDLEFTAPNGTTVPVRSERSIAYIRSVCTRAPSVSMGRPPHAAPTPPPAVTPTGSGSVDERANQFLADVRSSCLDTTPMASVSHDDATGVETIVVPDVVTTGLNLSLRADALDNGAVLVHLDGSLSTLLALRDMVVSSDLPPIQLPDVERQAVGSSGVLAPGQSLDVLDVLDRPAPSHLLLGPSETTARTIIRVTRLEPFIPAAAPQPLASAGF